MDERTEAAKESAARRRELASFLRSAREALDPSQASGALNSRRRAKGWLREEVAAEAGISATWYMWLEQARDVRASPRALGGLVRALRLDSARAAYLFRLARPDMSPTTAASAISKPSPEMRAFVAGLSPNPAYLMDERWDIVAYNSAADLLLGGIDPTDKWSFNLIARIFTHAVFRSRMLDWETIAASSVGQFRAATADLTNDPEHRSLVESLAAADAWFRSLWESHRIDTSPGWNKAFMLPKVGRVEFRYQSLRPVGSDDAFRLTLYSPVSDSDRQLFASASRRLSRRSTR